MTPDDDQPFTLAQLAGKPRRKTGLIIGVAAGAVALVAATVVVTLSLANGSTPQPAAQQSQAPASTPTAAAPVTTATAVTATPSTLNLGAKTTTARGSTAIAYAYKQPVAKNAPPPDQDGFEWGAADVEICPVTTNIVVNGSWRLIYADNTTIDPSSIGYQQFPEPAFPWGEREVAGGRCVRGWIVYPAPIGKKPKYIEFAPEGFTADWAVS